VKELLKFKLDSICESYAQMEKGSSFFSDSQCISFAIGADIGLYHCCCRLS